MSVNITTAMVEQYHRNVMHLAQQKMSLLRGKVREETIMAEGGYFDRIGASEMQERTTRHGDTPVMNTPHSRRRVDPRDFEWADLIDKQDEVRLLIDPRSEYVTVAARAAGRKMDDLIIEAANGTAKTGKDGSGSQTLPSAQIIAAASSGLTLAKLVEAAEIFGLADIDEDEPKCMVIGPKQVSDLLNNSTITSADYNTLRALMDGKIAHFMGFDFVRSNRLTLSSTTRQCLAFTRQAIVLGVAEDVMFEISPRADKSYATQVYNRMTMGAVRMEEVQVVEIDCIES